MLNSTYWFRRTIGPILLILLPLAIGCRKEKPKPPAPPPPAVSVAKPVAYPVQSYFEFNGYLEGVERVEIRARVKGYLDKVHFSEGSQVEKGKTLLYNIDSREYKAGVARAEADLEKANAEVATANAQIALATADVSRLRQAGGGVSGSELDKAKASLTLANAQLKAANANVLFAKSAVRTAELQVEFTKITAPISGRISRTLVTEGNLVGQTEATLLTTIVRMDELFVYFEAPERILVEYLQSSLATNQPSVSNTVKVEVEVATETGYPHIGTFDFRDNKVDTGTGTVLLRGLLKNPDREPGKPPTLYSGLFAKVRLPNGDERVLPSIPEVALMAGQQGRFVYVVRPDNTIEQRPVTLVDEPIWRIPAKDAKDPKYWTIQDAGKPDSVKRLQSVVAVESGLSVDERIVVNGLLKARPGEPVTPEEMVITAPPIPKK